MNLIIDSNAWTGLASYDVLTNDERTKDIQFGASLKLLFGGAGASLLFCGFGVLLIAMELRGYQSGVAFFNRPIFKTATGILTLSHLIASAKCSEKWLVVLLALLRN